MTHQQPVRERARGFVAACCLLTLLASEKTGWSEDAKEPPSTNTKDPAKAKNDDQPRPTPPKEKPAPKYIKVGRFFKPNDKEIFLALHNISRDFQKLRSEKATPEEWDAFSLQVRSDIAPVVEHLEQTASAKEPVKQNLLWAARDYLPQILIDARKAPDENEKFFTEHMKVSQKLLGIKFAEPGSEKEKTEQEEEKDQAPP